MLLANSITREVSHWKLWEAREAAAGSLNFQTAKLKARVGRIWEGGRLNKKEGARGTISVSMPRGGRKKGGQRRGKREGEGDSEKGGRRGGERQKGRGRERGKIEKIF